MHAFTPCLFRLAAIVIVALGFTGCVSSKYRAVEGEKQPVSLNLVSVPAAESVALSAPTVDAMVNTVIVLQGPGSWKRNAYWDEYVISLTNRGGAPLTIESAALSDFQGQTVSPGRDPWLLERQSRDYEARIVSTAGDVLKIGGGVFLAGGTGIAAGTAVALATGTGGWAAMGMLGLGFVAAIPVYAVGTVYRNVSNKHKIEEEFARRSLALPLTLPPGQLTQGSLFFRVSPGPRRLALRVRSDDGARHDAVIELAPLAGLHLKPAPSPKRAAGAH